MFSARWETAKNYVGKQSGHDSLRRRSHTSQDEITLAACLHGNFKLHKVNVTLGETLNSPCNVFDIVCLPSFLSVFFFIFHCTIIIFSSFFTGR